MSPLKRILAFAKPHQKYLFLSIFFNLLYSVFQIFSVLVMLPVLQMIFNVDQEKITKPVYSGKFSEYFSYIKTSAFYNIQESITEYGAIKVLAALCIITATSFLFRNISRYFGSFMLVNYRVGITKDLRSKVYQKFLKLPVSFFTEQRKGDMMSRISNDIGSIENSIMGSLVDVINAPFMITASLITLFALSPSLTLFSLLVFPVMGGIIKIFNADIILNARFEKTTQNWKNHAIAMSRRRELASPSSEFLGSVTILLITWFAGIQILEKQTMDAVTFIGFIAIFFQILEPAKRLSAAISNMQGGIPAVQRVLEVLDYDLKVEEITNPISIKNLNHQIEFKNISFYYDKDNQILKNFNLTIPRGKTVALVGQSGSGKTTIANLLARFYDVTDGEILIDGINIKDLNLTEYRKLLGMVTQESVLFNDSVYNNIWMGKTEASEEEVIQAAKIANAHQFIENLPEKYQTNIGDDGNKLSGGQKQRISIARAVLKNPPIMILDEATSALDTESERLVQDALDHMMENRTSIVIAHRLSTIQKADHIVVMERGNIVEQGTHDELIANNNVYKKLVELQNFG